MTLHQTPRDVLSAFKPKLVPRARVFADSEWARKVVALRKAIEDCEDFAAGSIFEAPERMAEHMAILEAGGIQAQNRRIAHLGASAAMIFDEMHRNDPNYETA